MDRRTFLAVPTILAGSYVLFGCAHPATPANAPRRTVVAVPPIAFIIPNDPAVVPPPGSEVEELSLSMPSGFGQSVMNARGEMVRRQLIRYRFSGDQGIVERRTETSDGIAGSGQVVRVKKTVSQTTGGKRVEFAPYDRAVYQDGLIMKFPVPSFEPEDIKEFFLSSQLYAKFEVDSDFNPASTDANFVRLFKSQQHRGVDPVSGKSHDQEFVLPLRGKEVLFVIETYPYRNGSKALAYCRIPAIETSPNTVDFGILLNEVRTRIVQAVKA
jgi:hypothetical protein